MQAYEDPDHNATLDDWAFSLAFAQDQAKYAFPMAPMQPCRNLDCTNRSYALYCSPACLAAVEPEVLEEPAEADDYYQDPHSPTTLGLKTLADTQWQADQAAGGFAALVCGVQPQAAPVVQPLPEAAASATVRLTIAGHSDVLFTVRDHSETRLLARLEALLSRFPVQAPAVQSPPVETEPAHRCPVHGVPMTQQTNAKGTWWSHRLEQGQWCKGRKAA